MRKNSFQNCRLYCIVDRAVIKGRDPVAVARGALRGGADVIQWRDKESCDREFITVAYALRKMTRHLKKLFIVNDRVEVALLVQADGIHVGHEDLSIPEVRCLVGPSMLIGRSTHSIAQAQEAEAAGADYLGIGPIFPTPTKPDYPAVGLKFIRQAKLLLHIPWVAVGGIDLATVPLVLSAGAKRVAVVRAIAGSAHPEEAARAFKKSLESLSLSKNSY